MISPEKYSQIMEALETMSSPDKRALDEKKSSFVTGMQPWLDDLSDILKKSGAVAPSQRRMFLIHYARWVKAYGSFYRIILRSNPGLAAVFTTIEDVFKIEVRVLGEGVNESIKIFDRESITEAEGDEQEFIATMVELIQRNPSTAIKAKFSYQFQRWYKQNPRELNIAESQTPVLYSFIQAIINEVDPLDDVNDSDMEHLQTTKELDKTADKGIQQ